MKKTNRIYFTLLILLAVILIFTSCNTAIEGNYKYEWNSQLNGWMISGTINKSITEVVVPDTIINTRDNVIGIADNAFIGNSNISKVSLSDKVKYIGTNAFRDCVNLTGVINFKNVTEIKSNAFNNTSVDKFIIPSNLIAVGVKAFVPSNLKKNTQIVEIDAYESSEGTPLDITQKIVYDWNTSWHDNYADESTQIIFLKGIPITSFNLDKLEEIIGFKNTDTLDITDRLVVTPSTANKTGIKYSLETPINGISLSTDGVITIDNDNIAKANTNINIVVTDTNGSASITKIATIVKKIFFVDDITLTKSNGDNVSGISIVKNPVIINHHNPLVKTTYNDIDVKIPDIIDNKKVIHVGQRAFDHFWMNSLTLGKNLIKVDQYAFAWLKIIDTTSTLSFDRCEVIEEIDRYGFRTFPVSFKLDIPATMKVIGCEAFGKSKVTSVVQLGTSSLDMKDVFTYCADLKTVKYTNVPIIYGSSFRDCTNLEKIESPQTTEIGGWAFDKTAKLTEYSFPNVSLIKDDAFRDSGFNYFDFPNLQTIYSSPFDGVVFTSEVVLPDGFTTVYGSEFLWKATVPALSYSKALSPTKKLFGALGLTLANVTVRP